MLEAQMKERYPHAMDVRIEELGKRLTHLEQVRDKQACDTRLKSDAAAAQANENLYAPLRSDTKPLLEMSAFVRKMAGIHSSFTPLEQLANEAREILKRST